MDNHWFGLLTLVNELNRKVKEHGWLNEDREAAYRLKDDVLRQIIEQKPDCLKIEMLYVPYYQYSNAHKDKAGEMMRRDIDKKPFEYYLALVEPSANETEIPAKASMEINIICEGVEFCFHQPVEQIQPLGIDVHSLPRKRWIPAYEFYHNWFMAIKSKIEHMARNHNEGTT